MKKVAVALGLSVAVVTGGAVGLARTGQEAPFPHEDHAGLFPLCTGCHEGVETGGGAAMYPEPSLCAECHDGVEEERVEWTGPRDEATNLRFDHPSHQQYLADDAGPDSALACVGCHTRQGTPRMAVEHAVAGRCLSCHAHRAESHLADASCDACHLPLAETRFSAERVAALSLPASHEDTAFLASAHGKAALDGQARCVTCHTRERCVSCHVDAGALEAVAGMPRAGPDLRLPPFEAAYPTPPSHRSRSWLEVHGRGLEPADCSTCHTRQDCTTCHVEPAPRQVAAMPDARRSLAPGAGADPTAPPSHETPFFAEDHGGAASGGDASCTTCHAESYCAQCHDAPARPGYHPPGFARRHSQAAYGMEMECANCHDATAFCRDCHGSLGMQARGRLDPGFHDADPAWMLRHGQAARQSLESCTTCHAQRDCLQCHAETGAFQVSPHGPGFDPQRLQSRNPRICFACHVTDPLGGDP